MTIIHECLSKGKNLVLMRHVLIVELEVGLIKKDPLKVKTRVSKILKTRQL